MNANSRLFVLKICLYSWMVVIPFSVALSNLLLIITCCVLAFMLFKNPVKDWKEILGFPAIILFGLYAISMLTSEDKFQALYEIKHNIPLVLSAFVVFFCFKIIPEYLKNSLIILIISTILAFVFSSLFNLLPFPAAKKIHGYFGELLQPFEESNHDLFGWYIPFMVRIQFGNLMSFLAIVSAVMAIRTRNNFWSLSAVALTIMVFVIGVRGSMLGLISASVFILIYLLKEKMLLRMKPAIIIGFVVLMIPILYYTYGKINARWNQTKFEIESFQNGTYQQYEYEHYSLLTRLVSWENGYQLWQKNKFLGTGIGDYKQAYALEYENDSLKVPLYYHSQWLYFLGVFGVIGLLLFVSSYIFWFKKMSSNKLSILYGLMLSFYLSVIWIFDAGMLSQIDIISFSFFTSFILCFKEN